MLIKDFMVSSLHRNKLKRIKKINRFEKVYQNRQFPYYSFLYYG